MRQEYGMEVKFQGIQDSSLNQTRFVFLTNMADRIPYFTQFFANSRYLNYVTHCLKIISNLKTLGILKEPPYFSQRQKPQPLLKLCSGSSPSITTSTLSIPGIIF